MRRRAFIISSGLAGLAALYWRYWPEDGFYNECREGAIPLAVQQHPLINAAIEGLDFTQVWDAHVHLVGLGDRSDGVWVNPDMLSWRYPLKHLQFNFYLDGSCTGGSRHVDDRFVERLHQLMNDLPPGMKIMLLAFDYFHDKQGLAVKQKSFFYTSNAYAGSLARQFPERFEWIASVHPYRPDSIELLEQAAQDGARAVKWLPESMGIDPASPRCVPFYQAMQRLSLPLLSHAGQETAVSTDGHKESGNPLLLRSALDQGVRVIVAHCASLGSATDLDQGKNGKAVPCFDLFCRMMGETQYDHLLSGEISAMLQMNRLDEPIKYLLLKQEWHTRLLNGSDYPLPGILPVIPLKQIVRMGLVTEQQSILLREVRRYNPVWFDLLLKKMLQWQGKRFANSVFETRRFFQ